VKKETDKVKEKVIREWFGEIMVYRIHSSKNLTKFVRKHPKSRETM